MKLYANPYDTSAEGFYFSTLEEFEDKYDANLPVEEYEIDFIEGTKEEAQLFGAANVDQAFLEKWFDFIDESDEDQWPVVYYLLGVGYDLAQAQQKAEDVSLYEGSAKEAVEQFVDDTGGLEQLGKDTLENYFDWDSYVRDLEANGEANEFSFGGAGFTILGRL
ncbi:hypothetical protein LCGC14_2470730 [marine sediment metagenome]|uniref:Antirestriction protein ArdA n=1 Tax=marine sediment metagenome TaxID=412755 RepID=A0A0F9BY92_9ZZZZ